MNEQQIKEGIKKVASNLASTWGSQPVDIDYLPDGTRVTYINDLGLTHIYLMIVINNSPYCSKVSVDNRFILDNTEEHFENMIHYCFFNTDFLKLRGVTGE